MIIVKGKTTRFSRRRVSEKMSRFSSSTCRWEKWPASFRLRVSEKNDSFLFLYASVNSSSKQFSTSSFGFLAELKEANSFYASSFQNRVLVVIFCFDAHTQQKSSKRWKTPHPVPFFGAPAIQADCSTGTRQSLAPRCFHPAAHEDFMEYSHFWPRKIHLFLP